MLFWQDSNNWKCSKTMLVVFMRFKNVTCTMQLIWQLSCTKAPKVAEGQTLRLVLILVGLHQHTTNVRQRRAAQVNRPRFVHLGRDQKSDQPQPVAWFFFSSFFPFECFIGARTAAHWLKSGAGDCNLL